MRITDRIGKIVERHAPIILIVVVVLSALAAWGVSRISVITTQDTFLSPKSEAFQGHKAYEEAFGGDSMLILIPGSPLQLATPEALQGFTELESTLKADPKIRSVMSPLTLLAGASAQTGLDLSDPSALLEVALSEGAAEEALADESLRTQLERFFHNNHALVVVRLAGGLTTDEQSEAVRFIQGAVDAGPFASDAIVAGNPRMISDITSAIFSGLVQTGVIAVVLMVLILFIAFPARWRLLSLPLVLLGVLWTFGIAATAHVPLTLVTLAGLPVLIGLGVDFGIQFHNRYEEEMRRGQGAAEALKTSISRIAPTMGVAVAVMVLGFMTLLISTIPAVKDFGVLLAIGAAVLYIVSLFVLNAFLYRFDRQPRIASAQAAGGLARRLLAKDWLYLGKALPAVARWSRHRAVWVVLVAVALAAFGFAVDRDLDVQADIEKLIPTDTPGVVALNQAREVVGSGIDLPVLIQAPDVTAPLFLEWLVHFQTETLASHPEVVSADSVIGVLGLKPGESAPSADEVAAALDMLPREIRDGLVSADGTKASLTLTMSDMEMTSLNDLIDDITTKTDLPTGVSLTTGGAATLTARTVEAFAENRGLVTGMGILVVLLGLLAIYRNWRRALIAVVPIVLVTGWSSALMWVAGIDLSPLTAVLGALVIAIGTEFTVLLLSRYWEEKGKGNGHALAMEEAVAKVGRAITASALTVAAGFGALIASSFPALRDFGIVTVVNVVFALIVTLTVVPALVRWFDPDKDRSTAGGGRARMTNTNTRF
ncbi:MAG: RND family transporter [Actinobacteria bacterium]|nr:RND family transporter [Actinomycetota bacterium]